MKNEILNGTQSVVPDMVLTQAEWSEMFLNSFGDIVVVALGFGVVWIVASAGLRALYEVGIDAVCKVWPRFEKLRRARCRACGRSFDWPKG